MKLFSDEAPAARYYCDACKDELATVRHQRGGGQEQSSTHQVSASGMTGKLNNGMAMTGFVLGLISVVLYVIGIIPILAAVFSGIGLATFKQETQKNRWLAGVGLALGVVYSFVMLNHHGHLR